MFFSTTDTINNILKIIRMKGEVCPFFRKTNLKQIIFVKKEGNLKVNIKLPVKVKINIANYNF